MLFRDWWRVLTPYGYVELELDDAGVAPSEPLELDETENVLDVLTYGVEHRDPRITHAILEIYAQAHPEDFPPGLALSSLSARDIDGLLPTLMRFLTQRVAAGAIRLYEDDVAIAQIDVLDPSKYVPQPVVPEKTTFIGVRLEDESGAPVRGAHVRLHLPDGDVKERWTNSEGEIYIDGIAVDGIAKVEFLDYDESAVQKVG